MLKAIDLFSGSGGTTSGLKKSGIPVVAAVEIDKNAAETYALNNPEVNLMLDDIRNVGGEELKAKGNIDKGDTLMLVACPPCQGFSSIRNGGENDIRNELVFEFERLIDEMKPEFILMENVAGMARGKGKKIFKTFLTHIEQQYVCARDILNAANYGVPQLRKRLVLHGIRRDKVTDESLVSLPVPTYSQNGTNNTKKWRTVRDVLTLPAISAGEDYESSTVHNHCANNLNDINIERIRYIRKHGGSRKALPERLVLNCHKNKSGHGDVYGILSLNKPAVTMTGGCMTYSKGRFGHPTEDRALSAREAARLQSFDDSYIFCGTRGQMAKQIGNAVPVLLAEASGKWFKNYLKENKSMF